MKVDLTAFQLKGIFTFHLPKDKVCRFGQGLGPKSRSWL